MFYNINKFKWLCIVFFFKKKQGENLIFILLRWKLHVAVSYGYSLDPMLCYQFNQNQYFAKMLIHFFFLLNTAGFCKTININTWN